jgi:hypothetical protein
MLYGDHIYIVSRAIQEKPMLDLASLHKTRSAPVYKDSINARWII